jgi:hypothetical protein
VFGLKHSTNQADKGLIWNGSVYDPAKSQTPPAVFLRQDGGDLGGSQGKGYYWYETSGTGFQFPASPQEHEVWRTFGLNLPADLVFGLKHSVNQRGKFLVWLGEPKEFSPWVPGPFDPVNQHLIVPLPFERQNGGDRDGSDGEGFYWYEVNPGMVQPSNCDASLPGGLVFGLKHSLNQPNKKFLWQGVEYDAAQREGPKPDGFSRCHGGDLGASSGQGYYWFETVRSSTQQHHLGDSCEASGRWPN